MKDDPLNPGAVTPLESDEETKETYDDARPVWLRLLTSLRPSVSRETLKRTGETVTEVEIKGHIDF